MTDVKQNLLLFFDRPREPCFMQKGDDKTIFLVPESYYPEKYKTAAAVLSKRLATGCDRVVPIRNIALPDLSLPLQLPYSAQFSILVPKHCRMAVKLIDIFLNMRDLEDLLAVCCYCQMHINPYMFIYCLSVAILHRPDTKGLHFRSLAELFPEKYMDPRAMSEAREVSSVVPQEDRSQIQIEIPPNYTASDREPEQRVAYFREDIGINLHHWYWHLVYPFDSANRAIVDKDRRGELFYYMHQQIIARYNAERLCNNMDRVVQFKSFREPIAEAYFPKMDSKVASRAWPGRFAESKLYDVHRPLDDIKYDIYDLEKFEDRFLQAVKDMAVLLPDGSQLPLDEETGIDVLGNLMESSILSKNRNYYGQLHNMGHLFIAYCHDPDNKYMELLAVMGDPATAMRDPVFYRWHAHVDDMFQEYKKKLPRYRSETLNFPAINVSSIAVESPGGANTFSTHWEKSTVELSHGLDFSRRGSVKALFTHLQHEEFTYKIMVNNTSSKEQTGTVRIFMAPELDEKQRPLGWDEQRRLMIELDKFSHKIPPGSSTITRHSTESSVTIPYYLTFGSQAARRGEPGSAAAAAAAFDFCGCGWPQHMLIPKGNEKGFPVVLFVMISNWNEDRVVQDTGRSCTDAASYCGIRDHKYPDRRAMGYPFDRPTEAANLTGFLTSNMAVCECSIRFKDETRLHGAPQ